ncbi:DUF2206 domain-containing protein, partial [candidate division WOR-3 bacterium]|nr:DUF2206 domain-containing protein [candidate division WOR-3 bacterium]
FFIMVGTVIGIEILSIKYTFKKVVSLTIVLLFFSMIFFWYSQVTETAFSAGVGFIEKTFINLHEFFVLESRGSAGEALLGKGIMEKGIPQMIEFVFTWLTFALIGIGIITLIIRYKEMSFPELKFKKPEFLKDKFEVEYFVLALACAGLLVVVIGLPFVAAGYGLSRMYPLAITILSVFFVIGGIMIAKYLNKLLAVLRGKALTNLSFKKKALLKKQKERKNALQNPVRKSVDGKDASEVRAYFIMLLVLIPYFFCVTGVTYQMFGYHRTIILNSGGEQYDRLYVHDQESYGARWLWDHADEKAKFYADFQGSRMLLSQGNIMSPLYNFQWLSNPAEINGYIYIRCSNIMNGELIGRYNKVYNITDYQDVFLKKNKSYSNGDTEVYR